MIRKENFFRLLILLVALGCPSVGQTQDTAQLKAQVKEIADADWRHTLEQNIFLRFKFGLPIKKLPDISVEQAGKNAAYARSLIRKIDAVPKRKLDHEDALTLDILRWQAQNAVEEQKYYWLMFPVTPYVAGQSLNFIHQVLAGQRFKTADDLANYLGLADEYAAQLDQVLAKIKGQDRKGMRLPKPEIPAVVALFSAHRANSEKIFSVPAPRLDGLADLATSDFQARLQAAIRERINPAFDRLIAFLQGDYEQRAPETVGYSQYPDGKAYYRYLVRLHTTLDLTPERVHEIGLKRVAELGRQMQQIRDSLGFKGTQAEFHQMLGANPRFLAKTPAEVEERYLSYIRRMEPLIARYFAKTPKAPYGVKRLNPAVEASMTFGYYQPPTPDNPVGQYHYNGSRLQDRSLVMAGPLIYHELIPGHHFHLASQSENTELPMSRRESLLAGAFNEGWGNYAAGLAAEAGLLDDPYDRYGKAIFDMFISVRLVVDTGMNCFGWPLQRARDYMKQHTFQSETEINSESLRYSVDLPGQALAYRIGVDKIEELRRNAKEQFGPITWGIMEPESGALMARRAVQTLVQEALKSGVDYLPEAVLPPAGKERLAHITTRGGARVSAGSFVFACGPWLPKVFPDLLKDRIHPTRQEVFFFGAPPGDRRFAPPAMPVWADFGDEIYGIPDLENRGFKIALDRHGPAFDPDTGKREATAEGEAAVRQYLARRFPGLKDAPLVEARVCQYENTSNGDFLIDRHPAFSNVWLVGGGSGHGFKHGPALGEYVAARIIEGGAIEPRFTLATKGKAQKRAVY